MARHLQPLGPIPRRALCLLLIVGDGGLAQTRELLTCCVNSDVDVVELCAPFPNAFTDGEVIRQAHRRALARGVVWQDLLPLIAEFSSRIRIVALLDYSHVFARINMTRALQQLRDAGAAAVLPHGLPPRARPAFYAAAVQAELPVVGTLYPQSSAIVRQEVLRQTGGFIYLVSHFGRSGGARPDVRQISDEIARLKMETSLPIALGFGLKSASDVATAFNLGADMAIVGSQVCAVLAAAQANNQSLAAALEIYIHLLKKGESDV